MEEIEKLKKYIYLPKRINFNTFGYIFFSMRFLISSVLAFTSIAFAVNAQEVNLELSKKDTTTEYYKDVSDQLLVKVFTSASFLKLGITNIEQKKNIQLEPTGNVNLGGAFNYKWLGLGATIGLPSNQAEVDKKGKTTRLDLMLNVYNKRFLIDAYYQNYKGYHLNNAASVANWKSDTLPQFNDLKMNAFIVSGLYIFNYKKFSIKSAFTKNAIQLKSAGSLLAGVFYNLDAADNPNGFLDHDSISFELKKQFPFASYTSSSYGASIGYSYNFVFSKHWYANATLSIGVGVNQFSADTVAFTDSLETILSTTGSININKTASQVIFRGSFGYEKNNWIVGLNYIGNIRGIKVENYQLNPSSSNVRLFVAYRFNKLSTKNKSKPEKG